jgi:hypothetical protein
MILKIVSSWFSNPVMSNIRPNEKCSEESMQKIQRAILKRNLNNLDNQSCMTAQL